MEKLADVKVLACSSPSKEGPVWLRLGDYQSQNEMINDLNRKVHAESELGFTYYLKFKNLPDWLPGDSLLPLYLAFMQDVDEDIVEAYAKFIGDDICTYGNDADRFVRHATEKMICRADDDSLMNYALQFMDDNNVPYVLNNFVNSKGLLIEFAQHLLYDCTIVDIYYFSNQ